MLSSVCCRNCGRQLMLLLCLILLMSCHCEAARLNRSAFIDDVSKVRSVVVDPNNRTIWSMFNLTDEQVSRIQNRSTPTARDETQQATNHMHLQHVASRRLNEIKNQIQIAVTNQSDENKDTEAQSQSQHSQPKTLHMKAGYPICNAETSQLNWQQSNNVTLQFAASVFQRNSDSLSLDSALLRLYKMDPKVGPNTKMEEDDSTIAAICPEPVLDSQIQVTVSLVHQQKKKQRKKRTCNITMLNSSKVGWVDIDVKCALNYWEQQQHQHQRQPSNTHTHPPSLVGLLMIEVFDDEGNQLKPGLYFEPPKCDQADPAIPWSVYGTKTPVPCLENRTMPRYPRLDVRFIGDAHFVSVPKNREQLAIVSTTSNSPTVDNLLEELESENESESQDLHKHPHHGRHHHSQQQHHHHHHHHQKHRHVLAQKQE